MFHRNNKIIVLLLLLITASLLYAQNQPFSVNNKAFDRGEFMKFRVSYSFLDAGEIILQITDKEEVFFNNSTFHIVGEGYSLNIFDWFFKVRDHYETYMDEELMIPYSFIRRVYEGGYTIEQDITFDPHQGLAQGRKGWFHVPENCQDMLSVFYYLRCLNLDSLQVYDTIGVATFIDNEIFRFGIKFLGMESVKTNFGKINCMKFSPTLQEGRIFKDEEDMTVWITADKNRIPILLKTDLLVGSIKAELISYKDLANPIIFENKPNKGK